MARTIATMAMHNDSTDLAIQDAYRLSGVPWVPHYSRENIFVPPGAQITLNREQLVKAGATLTPMLLWKRSYRK